MSVRYLSPRFEDLIRQRALRFKPVSGQELRKIMEHTGLSHTELGYTLGVHNSTVWRWLEGETSPNQSCSILLRLLASRRAKEETLLHLASTPYSSG